MMQAGRKAPRLKPERPWWRTPIQYLLRARLRRRHVHGTLVHRVLGERLFDPALWIPARDTTARGMAIGVFVGFLPVPGLQIFFSALLCYILRSNVPVAALATFITNPFTTPPIIWMQYRFGLWLMPFLRWTTNEYEGVGWHFASYGKPFLVGSLASSVLLCLIAYPLTLLLWSGVETFVRRRREARLRRLRAQERPDPPRTAD